MSALTQEYLKSVLDYDANTGIFRWKRRIGPYSSQFNGRHAGKMAGIKAWNGYILIHVAGRLHRAHRLAWFYIHGRMPEDDIDHIDGDRANNALANIRCANRSENLANSWRESDNTSGFKGVSWRDRKKPWVAHIKHMGRSRYIGSFYLAEEAHAAYQEEAKRIWGEFAFFGESRA